MHVEAYPHPLLRLIEIDKIMGQPSSDLTEKGRKHQEEMAKKKISDLKKREEFLRTMANFRPTETVSEAFATGSQKDVIHNALVDKVARGSAAALGVGGNEAHEKTDEDCTR